MCRRAPRTVCLALVLLAACDDVAPAPRIERTIEDRLVRDVHPREDGVLDVVLETPVHLAMETGPRRALVRIDARGVESTPLDSTGDRALLDVAPHPSGETTALFASDAGFELVRLDATLAIVGTTPIIDGGIDADPPVIPGAPPASPIELLARDVGRIEPVGEDVIAATRTGRHSVIAYRFVWDGVAFTPTYRTLVVPPHGVIGVGLTGGSYDIFGQVANPHVVYLAVDEDGLAYVGTTYELASPDNVVEAHAEVFGETLVGDPDHTDGYVTRLGVDGARLGTSVITTELEDQVYGLRAVRGAAYVLGRNELWNAAGTGHDALVARVDAATGQVETFAFDVRDGDIAFDAAVTGAGELVVFGASGYAQNPQGASITDASEAFARVFAAEGGTRDLALPASARHDVPFVVRDLGRGALLVAGMLDGPGTHTADSDITQLYARGFVTTLRP